MTQDDLQDLINELDALLAEREKLGDYDNHAKIERFLLQALLELAEHVAEMGRPKKK